MAVLAWGVLLLLQARQPVWVERRALGVAAGSTTRSVTQVYFMAGMLWSLMPCGLLYRHFWSPH